MRPPRREGSRARREAAVWFTRLSRRAVTTDSLRDFRDWRTEPTNREEYERLERVWRQAGRLSADPEIEALRRETLARTARPRFSLPSALPLWVGAGLTAAVASLVVALYVFNASPTYESGIGEQRIVRLSDGTVLRLDTDSRAVVKYEGDRRVVELQRGRAFFDVAHNPARPFTVRADGAAVTALGTKFDVRRDKGGVQVLLLEGAVRVEGPANRAVTLRPNQGVALTETGLQTPASADVRRLTSWTERRLNFQATPLAEAVAEVNRYSDHKVRLQAEDLAAAPVSGVFETGDTATFAAAAASLFDLEVEQQERSLVLRRHGSPRG